MPGRFFKLHMDPQLIGSFLLNVIRCHSSESARKWFDQVYSHIDRTVDSHHFTAAYSGVRRRLGTKKIIFHSEDEDFPFDRTWMPLYHATLDELGRASLLLRATDCLPQEQQIPFIGDIYQHGDCEEQQALLRILAYLPCPSSYRAIAVEACRSNVKPVFEAIACTNTYPFHYFPDSNFNQMILKALFIGSSLHSIVGLHKRLNSQLRQMAIDFARERRAAGRPLPKDIELILSNQECHA